MKKCAIIILNFNGWRDTIECVKSIQKIHLPRELELSIIIVDNGSANESVEKIKKNLKNVKLLENSKNLGFAGGCNTGIKFALDHNSDFIVLLNNDTIVEKKFLSNLIKTSENESVGVVVPKIYFAKGHEFHKDKYKDEDLGKVIWYAGGQMDWQNLIGKNLGVDEVDHGQFDTKQETDLITGCCFLVKAEVLRKVGLFDERYFLYYEDADLTQRIKMKGYKIVYDPEAIIWHVNAGSGGGSGSILQDYYISRNRLLFGMTYAPLRTRLALTRESLKLLVSGRTWQKRGARDYYLRKFGLGSFRT